MKRWELLRYLREHGCEFLKEGTRHTVYANRAQRRSSTVPLHVEIPDGSARKVCRDLGIPPPP